MRAVREPGKPAARRAKAGQGVAPGAFIGRLLAACCVIAIVGLSASMTTGWQPALEPQRPLAADHIVAQVPWPEPPAPVSFSSVERVLDRRDFPHQSLSEKARRDLLSAAVAVMPDMSLPAPWQDRNRWMARTRFLLSRTLPESAADEITDQFARHLRCEWRRQSLVDPLMAEWPATAESLYLRIELSGRWDSHCLEQQLASANPEQEMMRQAMKRQLILQRKDLSGPEQDRLLAELDRQLDPEYSL